MAGIVPLGGNVGVDGSFVNGFNDLTIEASQISPASWSGPTPAQDEKGNMLGDFWMVVYAHIIPGTYKGSFRGAPNATVDVYDTANVPVSVSNRVTSTDGVTTFDIVMPEIPMDANSFHAFRIGFGNTGGTLQDLHVYRPGYDPKNPKLFSEKFFDHFRLLKPTCLRMMDAAGINHSVMTEWSERSVPDRTFPLNKTVTRSVPAGGDAAPVTMTTPVGVPYEHQIELCNGLGVDIWVNIPMLASDDFVTQLAKLIKNGSTGITGKKHAALASNLNCYFEYGNENWNYSFWQSQYNLGLTKLENNSGKSNYNYDGGGNIYQQAQYRTAKRTYEITKIFEKVFGKDQMRKRIRPIWAGQQGGGSAEDILRYLQANYGNPAEILYGIANTQYFGLTPEQDATAKTVDDVVSCLQTNLPEFTAAIRRVVATSKAWGLVPVAYEGGINAPTTPLQKQALASPKVVPVLAQYLNEWYAAGGDLFCWYSLGANAFGNSGWGLTGNILDLKQPKELAFKKARETPPPPIAGYPVAPVEIEGRYDAHHSDGKDQCFEQILWGGGEPVDYAFYSPTDADYNLVINCSAGNTIKTAPVKLNGKMIGTLTLATDPSNFADSQPLPFHAAQGVNVLRITIGTFDTVKILDAKATPLAKTLPHCNMNTYIGGPVPASVAAPYSMVFMVSDDHSSPDEVIVQVSADNKTLIPDANIKIETGDYGYGHNRRVTITPASGLTGLTKMKVTIANKAGASRSSTFMLNVATAG